MAAAPLLPADGNHSTKHEGAPVSVSEVLSQAILVHPRIEAARQRVEAAQARVRALGGQANPLLDIGFSAGGTNVGSRDEDLILTQTFDLSQQRVHRRQAAEAERDAVQADLEAAMNDLGRELRLAFTAAQLAERLSALEHESVQRAERLKRIANQRVDQGVAPQTAALRAEVELLRARRNLQQADVEVATRMEALRALGGMPSGSPLELTPLAPEERAAVAASSDALPPRPELFALKSRVEAREQELRAVGAGRWPDLVLAGRRARVLAPNADVGLRASLQVPLFDFGAIAGAQAEAEAGVAERRALLRAEEARVKAEVSAAKLRLAAAKDALAAYETGIVARSRTLVKKAQMGFEAGVYSLLEVLDAQEALHQAETARLLATAELANAQTGLLWALGQAAKDETAGVLPDGKDN